MRTEELRHTNPYQPGIVPGLAARQSRQRLGTGRYDIAKVDGGRVEVALRDAAGQQRNFKPSRLGVTGDSQAIQLHERKPLTLYIGNMIRWTANDHRRGLINADRAKVTAITDAGVAVKTSAGMEHLLRRDDPMLARIDLAYAPNAHMAQGLKRQASERRPIVLSAIHASP